MVLVQMVTANGGPRPTGAVVNIELQLQTVACGRSMVVCSETVPLINQSDQNKQILAPNSDCVRVQYNMQQVKKSRKIGMRYRCMYIIKRLIASVAVITYMVELEFSAFLLLVFFKKCFIFNLLEIAEFLLCVKFLFYVILFLYVFYIKINHFNFNFEAFFTFSSF